MSLTCQMQLLSFSFVSCNTSRCGLSRFVEAWNFHSIPGIFNQFMHLQLSDIAQTYYTGRGVPNALQMECNRLTPLQAMPTTSDAAQLYRLQGGSLVQFGMFGVDQLHNRPDLIWQRESYFSSCHPSFDDIFSNIVSADGLFFQEALLDFIRITKSYYYCCKY